MTEAEARAAVVAEAMSWIGTPYHSHARVKGVGVDCAQLPAAVYEAVGLIEPVRPEYSPDWMLHRDEEKFLAYVLPQAREIPEADARSGDMIIWRYGRTYSHSAIIIEMPQVVHAVIRGAAVILADVSRDSDLVDRPRRFFTVFGRH